MQERHNSIASALELRLSCTNLSIYWNELKAPSLPHVRHLLYYPFCIYISSVRSVMNTKTGIFSGKKFFGINHPELFSVSRYFSQMVEEISRNDGISPQTIICNAHNYTRDHVLSETQKLTLHKWVHSAISNDYISQFMLPQSLTHLYT